MALEETLFGLLQRNVPPVSPPKRRQRHPHGDGTRPRGETAVAAKRVQMTTDLDQRLLHAVIDQGIVGARASSERPPQRSAQQLSQLCVRHVGVGRGTTKTRYPLVIGAVSLPNADIPPGHDAIRAVVCAAVQHLRWRKRS